MNILNIVKNIGLYTDLSIYSNSVFDSKYVLEIDSYLSLELRYVKNSEEFNFIMKEGKNSIKINEDLSSVDYIHSLIGVDYYGNLEKLKNFTDKIELHNKLINKLVEKNTKIKTNKI